MLYPELDGKKSGTSVPTERLVYRGMLAQALVDT